MKPHHTNGLEFFSFLGFSFELSSHFSGVIIAAQLDKFISLFGSCHNHPYSVQAKHDPRIVVAVYSGLND